jgi:RNA recognition motif-containing protein
VRKRESDLEGWTCVRPRRRRGQRLDQDKTIMNSLTNTGTNKTTTCYVNNLPEDVGQREVERMFERWGKVVDVYIAKKRNKMGKFFGFVRYVNVKDEKWLENQLRDIWLGSYKVWVNNSKFERPFKKHQHGGINKEAGGSEYRCKERTNSNNNNNTKNAKNNARRGHNARREGKSYAEAIQIKTVQKKEATRYVEREVCSTKEGTEISIVIKEDEMMWAKQGFVGIVRNIEEIESLQQRIVDEGIMTVRVIPMGGEQVFLKVDENEDFSTLVKEEEDFFSANLFYSKGMGTKRCWRCKMKV